MKQEKASSANFAALPVQQGGGGGVFLVKYLAPRLAAVIAAAVCFFLNSCDHAQFMDAVNDSLNAAEFSHFESKQKSASGEVYAKKGGKLTTIWHNPQNTRYDAFILGVDSGLASAEQDEHDRSKVCIYIQDGIETDNLDIILQLKPIKGEVKRPPHPLSIHIVFRDDDSEEDGAGEWDEDTIVIPKDADLGEALAEIMGKTGSGGSVTIGIPSGMPPLEESIEIKEGINLTIKGDGETVIEADFDNAPFFTVFVRSSLTLENITLDGGAKWEGGTETPPSPAFGAENNTTGRVAQEPLIHVSGEDATLTLGANAVIKNNDYHGSGSGVYVEAGGILVMEGNGAKIEYNRSGDGGGGVYVMHGARFKLIEGSINNNYAGGGGGGVYNDNGGTFTIVDGVINKNKTGGGDVGGGVRNIGAFEMQDGTISENTANQGGGVCNDGAFTMSGGTIGGNTANSGKGVYNNETFKMSGGAKVNNGDDVSLANYKKITIGENLSGTGTAAVIRLSSYSSGTQVLDGDKAEENVHRFEVSGGGYYVYADAANAGKIHSTKAAKRTVGGIDCYYPTLELAVNKTTSQDTVTLLENVDAASITIASGKHIKLNGSKTITRTSSFRNGVFFTINSGASLTLENITLDGGAKWGTDGSGSPAFGAANSGVTSTTYTACPLVRVYGIGATLTLVDNAVLKNNTSHDGGAVFVDNGGKLIMDSDKAEIAYNQATGVGGGVYIGSGGSSFELKRGKIHNNNQSENDGGGVRVGGGSTFTMTGGIITKNRAQTNGGGVATAGGNFTMSGGAIEENYAAKSGGGVRVADNASNFTMSGGEIKNNHALDGSNGNGGGVYLGSAGVTFTMSGGTISGNTAASNGKGVYHAGNTFTMKGSAVVNTNNDVYLASGKTITVSGDLSAVAGAKITPNAYTPGRALLSGDLTEANIAKFSLTPNTGDEYAIDSSDGKLARVLAVPNMTWEEAKTAISDGVDNANYIVKVSGEVTGSGMTSYTFGSKTGLKVTLGGSGSLRLASDGALIRLGDGQTVILDGPKLIGISNNTALIGLHGAVATTKLILLSGAIQGNTNTRHEIGNRGGGVYLNGGTFEMKGGTIRDNHANGGSGGGVYAEGGSVFSKTGGIVYGANEGSNSNTAASSGHAVYYNDEGKYRNSTLDEGSGGNISTVPLSSGWNQ